LDVRDSISGARIRLAAEDLIADTVADCILSFGTMRNSVLYALLAAVLFGASTPFAKLLIGELSPILRAQEQVKSLIAKGKLDESWSEERQLSRRQLHRAVTYDGGERPPSFRVINPTREG